MVAPLHKKGPLVQLSASKGGPPTEDEVACSESDDCRTSV